MLILQFFFYRDKKRAIYTKICALYDGRQGAEAEKYKGDTKEDVRRMFLADKTAAIMTKKTGREWVASFAENCKICIHIYVVVLSMHPTFSFFSLLFFFAHSVFSRFQRHSKITDWSFYCAYELSLFHLSTFAKCLFPIFHSPLLHFLL